MLLNAEVDILALGQHYYFACEVFCIELKPLGNGLCRTFFAKLLNAGKLPCIVPDRDNLAGSYDIGSYIYLLAVNGYVTVCDELTSHGAAFAEAKAVNYVVKSALENLEHVVTG